MSSGDPSKLLTTLNTFATGKNRAPRMTEPEIPGCERVVLSEDEMETSDHGRGHDSGDLL